MSQTLGFVLVGVLSVGISTTTSAIEHEGVLRSVGFFAENPNDSTLFADETESGYRLSLRENLAARFSDELSLHFNAYALALGGTQTRSPAMYLIGGSDEQNRTKNGERHWHSSNGANGYLTADWLYLRSRVGPMAITAGRFPINLATTTVFTPNDFFAPFGAQTYYRGYKPGVDALRFDLPLGDFGQVSALGVVGYDEAPRIGHLGDADDTNRVSYERSSGVASYRDVFWDFEMSAFVGRHGRFNVFGGSLQGELFQEIGIKGEAHYRNHRTRSLGGPEVVLGLDYRLLDDVLLLFEQFHHGTGFDDSADYQSIEDEEDPPEQFLGRNYSAAGFSYEITPLWRLRSYQLVNWTDDSALLTGQLAHSLSEEADFAVLISIPRGKGPKDGVARSEFGTLPAMISLETVMFL